MTPKQQAAERRQAAWRAQGPARTAMCLTCPYFAADPAHAHGQSWGQCRRHDTGVQEMVATGVTINGRPFESRCDRHPSADGRVKWRGFWWYGVPGPLRARIKAKWPDKHPEKLPGCGCLVALKAIAARLRISAWADHAAATVLAEYEQLLRRLA